MQENPRTTPRRRRGRVAMAAGLAGATVLATVSGVSASSHREAPLTMVDPVADNTDVYAFTSRPGFVTLIANYVPAEDPAAGPNYFRFGEDVLYSIHVDNDGDAVEDVTYEWKFRNDIQNDKTFLYATGQITSLDDEHYNFRQVMDVFVVRDGRRTQLVSGAIVPPSNIGPVATPNYEQLAQASVRTLPASAGPDATGRVFAGQRDDAFFGDIGAIFDTGQLRPLLPLYKPDDPAERDAEPGRDFFAGYNVHTTTIEVPIAAVRDAAQPVIGVWATASRPKVRVFNKNSGAQPVHRGRFVQVSRLGNPLVNEVVIPLGLKDTFNTLKPAQDAAALSQPDGSIPLVQDPELGRLIEALYPVDVPPAPRNDLVSVFLTGIEGVNKVPNGKPAEVLRLNTNTAPADVAWPNGRKLSDDVIDTALKAVAGGYALTPDFNKAPNNAVTDGVDGNDAPFRTDFPYQATPWQGFGENNETRGKTTGTP